MKTKTLLVLALFPHLVSSGFSAESNASLWQMISQGGWAMIPLGLTSLILIYLIIHCYRETAPKNFGNESLAKQLADLCSKAKREEALIFTKNESSLLSRAVATTLEKLQKKVPQGEELESSFVETFDLEEHAINQWIQYLAVVATVAPMVGLLGTVSGMIGAFQTMSSGGMGRPELLAGDIGEALITTATGLSIGIPAMVFHSFFSNRLENQLVATSQQATPILDALKSPESE